ncbi:MAG: hypothetical protein JSS82_17505 [Bacteroidetes bacterium]|nr:hypothetical protein [Bacteroidota bacterium]
MSPRSIFMIILRVMGLLILKDILFEAIGIIALFFNGTYGDTNELVWRFALLLIVLVAYYGVFHLLMFKTGTVIDRLKLDDGFEKEDFSFFEKKQAEVDHFALLNLALLIIGLYMFINEIPMLIRVVSGYNRTDLYSVNTASGTSLLTTIVKLILGYVLVAGHIPISNFIVSRWKQNVGDKKEGV